MSFVLTDKLEIRRIRPLDVVKKGAGGTGAEANADERFDSDMTLSGKKLPRLAIAVCALYMKSRSASRTGRSTMSCPCSTVPPHRVELGDPRARSALQRVVPHAGELH